MYEVSIELEIVQKSEDPMIDITLKEGFKPDTFILVAKRPTKRFAKRACAELALAKMEKCYNNLNEEYKRLEFGKLQEMQQIKRAQNLAVRRMRAMQSSMGRRGRVSRMRGFRARGGYVNMRMPPPQVTNQSIVNPYQHRGGFAPRGPFPGFNRPAFGSSQ